MRRRSRAGRAPDPHHKHRDAHAGKATALLQRTDGVAVSADVHALVLRPEDVDIVLELIGGNRSRAFAHPGGDRACKHVVTPTRRSSPCTATKSLPRRRGRRDGRVRGGGRGGIPIIKSAARKA